MRNQIGEYDEKWPEESKAKLLKQIDDAKRVDLIMTMMKKQMNKQKKMAYITFNNLWESEIDCIVSKRDKLQDLNINQIKLEVHGTYKKDEKITADFEAVDDKDVISKAYLGEEL